MKKQKKSFYVGKVITTISLGLLAIFLSETFKTPINKASEPYINPEYLQEYNQVQKLVGYTITLTYGAYSDKTKIVLCVFEVEKDDGKLIPPHIYSDNVMENLVLGGETSDGDDYSENILLDESFSQIQLYVHSLVTLMIDMVMSLGTVFCFLNHQQVNLKRLSI